MFSTSTLRKHAGSIALVCAVALGGSFAAAGDKPVSAASNRAAQARPCLVASENCRDLDSTPFSVCYTATTRCDQQSRAEHLALRATYAIYH